MVLVAVFGLFWVGMGVVVLMDYRGWGTRVVSGPSHKGWWGRFANRLNPEPPRLGSRELMRKIAGFGYIAIGLVFLGVGVESALSG